MPGTRHAKNNTALGYFTKHEKGKMSGWGTQKVRLSSDSLRAWDACGLCLKLPKEPLVCPNGDMFCKYCIFESLLNQKEHIKKNTKKYEKQQQALENAKNQEEQEKIIQKILAFHNLEVGNLANMKKKTSRNVVNLRKHDIGNFVTKDRQTVAQQVDVKERTLNCFWLPSLMPDNHPIKITQPDTKTYCPCCNNILKKKKLKPAKLIPVRNHIPEDVGEENYECSGCMKSLTNTHKKYHLRKCGHVICKVCVSELFSKEPSQPNSESKPSASTEPPLAGCARPPGSRGSKRSLDDEYDAQPPKKKAKIRKQCPLCSTDFKSKDLVALRGGGTGFAGSGNQVWAKKAGLAFQS